MGPVPPPGSLAQVSHDGQAADSEKGTELMRSARANFPLRRGGLSALFGPSAA